jgi:hypothetical protein
LGAFELRGDRLSSQHHVARHCRKNDLFWDPVTLTPTQVLECAFVPRAQEDDGLSTTWLEYFRGNHPQNMTEVRRHIRITPKQSNRLAVLNVGNIENAGNSVGLHAVEDPDDPPCPPGNPAHALIKEPVSFQDLRVREAVAFTVQAGDIETY